MLRLFAAVFLTFFCLSLWTGGAATAQGTPQPRIYVANSRSNSVTVIDPARDHAVVKTITGFAEPWGVAASQDGRYIFVTNSGNSTLSVIATATDEIISTVKVGLQPRGVAVGPAPDGKVCVANAGAGTLWVIDPAANFEVEGKVEVGLKPEAVVVTPDGRRAYVTDAIGNYVWVVDLSAPKPVLGGQILLPGIPSRGVAVSPNGETVYVASWRLGHVLYAISTAGNQVTRGIPLEQYPELGSLEQVPAAVVVSPNGNSIYVAEAEHGRVTVIDAETLTLAARVKSAASLGLAISADGKWVYSTSYFGQSIAIISDAINEVVGNLPVGNFPVGIAVKP